MAQSNSLVYNKHNILPNGIILCGLIKSSKVKLFLSKPVILNRKTDVLWRIPAILSNIYCLQSTKWRKKAGNGPFKKV